ncbi:hypothetical protein BDZ90DRAFT_231710 [Jaminaea rosea]|uniref:CHY-type domain-containing protein n=1 Tax=Jaminaea rosea TaxID=1569628 RepID=A0A316USG6_9BASI|nr:hypothetical protein BDZ90DRAFT_231710 [Jaminaea rosea]PWN27934.1 hypothetical protein BDZ90DRAFT_231710 [Jaminaea rosea]
MCKHILNAQVTVRAPCCQRFFDCPQCHAESSDHPLAKTTELAFVCKKCRRAFRRDLERFEQGSDDYCPHCDNCYVIDARTGSDARAAREAAAAAGEEGMEVPDAREDSSIYQALDPRQRYDPRRDFRAAAHNATEGGDRIDVGGLQGAVEQGKINEERRQDILDASLLAAASANHGAGGASNFAAIDDDLDWS